RHAHGGIPYYISQHVGIPVINAGDGYHEHPSQALLDAFTLMESLGDLANKHILILGDIRHSRVAKSNIWCLLALGARVSVAGPSNLIPPDVTHWGVSVVTHLDDVLPTVDAVNVLRIQFERQRNIALPSIQEYRSQFGITLARTKRMKSNSVILHPGPINRGVELDSNVADGPKNVILDQVANGVFIRMALLSMVMEDHTWVSP
ncbi:MAG: aspartate/ornithine carbamoyltransferase family protein, partial [Candidatus Marinamargulisbacteria bacterium]